MSMLVLVTSIAIYRELMDCLGLRGDNNGKKQTIQYNFTKNYYIHVCVWIYNIHTVNSKADKYPNSRLQDVSG